MWDRGGWVSKIEWARERKKECITCLIKGLTLHIKYLLYLFILGELFFSITRVLAAAAENEEQCTGLSGRRGKNSCICMYAFTLVHIFFGLYCVYIYFLTADARYVGNEEVNLGIVAMIKHFLT